MKNLISITVVFVTFIILDASAQDSIRLATTTSTENSGLLSVLNPPFEDRYNVRVDVIAVGTGKALRLGENGDVDVVLVHAPAAEKKFIADGFGIERLPVMHNDFVLLGPAVDPAGVRTATSITEAFQRVVAENAVFVSRGDDSGTHKKEMFIWAETGITPADSNYLSVGQSMGAVLTISNDKQAYTLSDRGTYLALADKIQLQIVYSGDPVLDNPYHIILINPEKHQYVNSRLAGLYSSFIRGPQGQKIIREFRVNGKPLFYPDVIP